MTTPNHTVLIVEDDFLIAHGLGMQVEEMGFSVCGSASSAKEAVALAAATRPAVVLMDVRLSGELDGVDAAAAIHKQVGAKVIFITGSREPSTQARIAEDHPSAVLYKPVSSVQLRRALDEALGGG
jgi:DNA-binding NarL/FixJ family response regulator